MYLNASAVADVEASKTSLRAEAGRVHGGSSYKTGWGGSAHADGNTVQINAVSR